MSLADFDAIVIRRKTNVKKKRSRAGMNDLEKEMKDMGNLSQSLQQVEKTGNNITLHLKIHLANKDTVNLNIQDTAKVSDVIDQLKSKLGITLNLFYLCELKENTQIPTKFFNNTKTLFQEKINDSSNLGFRMQWICPFNASQKTSGEKNIDYIYQCLKTTMFEEPFPIERKIANALAAVAIQMTFGNFKEQEATLIDIGRFCNPMVIENYGKENMLRSSMGIHEKLKNQTNLNTLKLSFIQMAQRSHSFGATMFDSVLSGKKVHVGIVYDGIIVYLSDLIEDITFYPMHDIKSIYSTGDSAVVYFKNNKNLQIKTGRAEKLVSLLSGYFYLCGETSPDVEKPVSLHFAEDDKLFDFSKKREEIVFLTNRLSYFHENIQVAAADAYLEQIAPKRILASILTAIKQNHNLTTINFASTDVSITQLTVFAESIDRTFKSRGGKDVQETFNAQELSLADNMELGKTNEFAKALCLILKSPIALKRIDLSNIGLTDDIAKNIVDGFRACNSLEYLNLSNNSELSGSALQTVLRSINRNALFRLDIRGLALTRQDAGQVIRLISDFPNLQQLIIKNNNIGAGGAELGNLVQRLKKLQILDVRHCGLPKDIVHSILKGLADSRVLKELRLSGNDGMGDVISYISDITEEGKIVKFPPINRLDVAGVDLSTSDVKRLMKIIQRPVCHLNAIDVSGAKLKGDMSKIFEILLAYEKTNLCITQFSANDCQISDSCASYMVNYLSCTTKLTKFKVGYNSSLFRKGNYVCIAEMIRGNKTLKNLHISGMNFPAEQIGSIFDAIINHPSLIKLSLDGNPLGSYMNKVSDLLMMCQHLSVLRLRKLEAITKDELINWLNNELPQTMSVDKICLEQNGLKTSDIKKAMDDHPTIHFVL
ncbi:leucine-rich repeat containing protein [Entamoeba histolytica HM-1:IMSS-B]|uniref:Leucine-rich repeat containing protein n=6 Tax=Entamoeba histolytica TaxID=5759 RepID=C4M553_ENTH1|nr:uncharacterized protein EHI_177990 [Entamoeba histolytica HM-1:IMSS]EMD49035.1 leucinerich repeat-containing protein [Entamoeba histolytica KU27]EMH74206.1 leucine-rich repeat containing protein [Entamoeba histolytica HM-1:IMSS-B]EMS14824.1 Leucine-rich repeat containing protein [Entamoeba histolytica HM-3:IMSS]ENY62527.1 Leucine-rich repeat containing protein [Entamoeba histolytica HM-1:IMSS-A]GAT96532.1 leucine-rich repeat containing protein [Entamoeba histolytica]|eukprot:XP_651490.1 uncharacterized protein EHI_177990 [Entamoeba histolytica HM-1:IMSS]